MQEEFYTRPVLNVRNVSASLIYYSEMLGFAEAWRNPLENPIIAQVNRNGLEIMLDSHSVLPKASTPTVLSMTLHQADQLGELHREFEQRGAKITAAPFEVMWQPGLYQFDVEDLDGNILIFWGNKPG